MQHVKIESRKGWALLTKASNQIVSGGSSEFRFNILLAITYYTQNVFIQYSYRKGYCSLSYNQKHS
ncbi:MAG TPA: hypothetical protein DCE41_17205 [Cytophagales bacterium]|nr:hypothetical protein [Cytophagales bacterium]